MNNQSSDPRDEDMPAEIDFSKGVRGLHYIGPDATISFPGGATFIGVDADVQTWLSAKAADQGRSSQAIANELLRRQIETIESMK